MASKLSIIVPVYNKGPFIGETLESLRNQSHSNCEFILVDDKSTDNSIEIMRDYAQRDERFKIIRRAQNGGLSLARNTGLEHATGEFVLFWDADDILRQGAGRKLITVAQRQAADVVKGILMRKNGNRIWITKRHQQILPQKTLVNLSQCPYLLLDISSCAYLIRREYLLQNNINFRSGLYMQDVLFTSQIYKNTDRIAITNIRIGEYVQGHDAQRGSSLISENRVHSLKRLLDLLLEENSRETNANKQYRHHIFETYINASLNTFYLDAVRAYQKDVTKRDRLIDLQILLRKIPEASIVLHGVISKDIKLMYELLSLRVGLVDQAVNIRAKGRLPSYKELTTLLDHLEYPSDLIQTINHLASSQASKNQSVIIRRATNNIETKKMKFTDMTRKDLNKSLDGLSSKKMFALLIRRLIHRLSFRRLGL